MKLFMFFLTISGLCLFISGCHEIVTGQIHPQDKLWYKQVHKIPVPEGYQRIKTDTAVFGNYLQNLPLKTSDNYVYLYDGTKKYNQEAQFAVIKMDVGTQDLQQCADAVMRLRGEYLYSKKKYNEIHFCFLSDGKSRYYRDYCKGDYSYIKFRKYMNYIFSYANTGSLIKELNKVNNASGICVGDVFIQKKNPYGHAVIVVDVAQDKNGNKIFMLAQSYMPAQEIHILKNPEDKSISPWYRVDFDENLITPEWTFTKDDLYRFRESNQ